MKQRSEPGPRFGDRHASSASSESLTLSACLFRLGYPDIVATIVGGRIRTCTVGGVQPETEPELALVVSILLLAEDVLQDRGADLLRLDLHAVGLLAGTLHRLLQLAHPVKDLVPFPGRDGAAELD